MSDLEVGEQVRLLLLQTVAEDRITRDHSGFHFDDGRRIWNHAVSEALAGMAEVGRVTLVYPERDPARIVGLTVAERAARLVLTPARDGRVGGAARAHRGAHRGSRSLTE